MAIRYKVLKGSLVTRATFSYAKKPPSVYFYFFIKQNTFHEKF